MTRQTRQTRLRVWIFMAASVSVFGLAVYAIGDKSGLFESSATLHANFQNLDGLVVGAPVRLSGLDIGTVRSVEFPEQLDQTKARVTLSVKAKYLPRIRQNSTAAIGSKGLLGDKLIDISVGDTDAQPLQDGSTLLAAETDGLVELSGSLKNTLSSIKNVADQADVTLKGLVTKRAEADVQRALTALADLAEGARDHKGLLHTLVYDEQAGQDARAVLAQARQLLVSSQRAAGRLDRILARVENGPGGAHGLLFGSEGRSIATDLQAAAAGIHRAVDALHDGDGTGHRLLYGHDAEAILGNLTLVTERLDRLMATIERGEGTVGGLLVDPTVYEDLKTLIGNVDRNVLLKALVRFAIKEGDLRRPAIMSPVQTPAAADGPASPSDDSLPAESGQP